MSAESAPDFSFSTNPQGSEHVVGRASVPNRIDPRATGEVAPELPGAIPGVPPEAAVPPPAESNPAQPAGLAAGNPAEAGTALTYDQLRLAAVEDAQVRTAAALEMISAAFNRKPATPQKVAAEYGPGQDPITFRASARVGSAGRSSRQLGAELKVLQPDRSQVRVPADYEDARGIIEAWSPAGRFGPQARPDQIPSSAAKSRVTLENDRAARRRGWVDHELEVRRGKLEATRTAAPAAARARAKAARRAMNDRINPPGPLKKTGRAIARGAMSAIRGVGRWSADNWLPAPLDFGAKNRAPSQSRTARLLRHVGINIKRKRAPYV